MQVDPCTFPQSGYQYRQSPCDAVYCQYQLTDKTQRVTTLCSLCLSSIESSSFHSTIQRLCQSMMAVKYRNPCFRSKPGLGALYQHSEADTEPQLPAADTSKGSASGRSDRWPSLSSIVLPSSARCDSRGVSAAQPSAGHPRLDA